MIAFGHGEMEEVFSCGVPVQLSSCVVSEIPVSGTARGGGREVCGTDDTRIMRVETNRDTGTECARGSRAHSGEYAAESADFAGDGVIERQDSDKTVQELSCHEEETVLGKPFLEPWILCQYRRAG